MLSRTVSRNLRHGHILHHRVVEQCQFSHSMREFWKQQRKIKEPSVYNDEQKPRSGNMISLKNASEDAESALRTLIMRCQDTVSNEPILQDPYCTDFLQYIEYNSKQVPKHFMRLATVLEPFRAKLIDQCIGAFVELRKGFAIQDRMENKYLTAEPCVLHIVELGVGFDTRFQRLFVNKVSNIDGELIATYQSIIDSSDYDIIYYYEVDIGEVLNIREKLMKTCDLDKKLKLSMKYVNDNNKGEILNDDENENSNSNIYRYNGEKQVIRQTIRLSILDKQWFNIIKHAIAKNHQKHIKTNVYVNEYGSRRNILRTGEDSIKNSTTDKKFSAINKKQSSTKNIDHRKNLDELKLNHNVCFVCEALFIHLKILEMYELITTLCNQFNGCYLISDESMTNEGLMKFDTWFSLYPQSIKMQFSEYIFQIPQVVDKLQWFARVVVAKMFRNQYRVFMVHFPGKPIVRGEQQDKSPNNEKEGTRSAKRALETEKKDKPQLWQRMFGERKNKQN